MIITLNQKRSDIKFSYELTHKSSIIALADIKTLSMGRVIELSVESGKYTVESCLMDDLKKMVSISKVMKTYIIKDGNSQGCGYIILRRSSFFFGYIYYEVMFKQHMYTIYEVGNGKEGLHLTVFDVANKQVALIDKEIKVQDYNDKYTMYLKSDDDALVMALFCTEYDAIRWGNRGKAAYKSTQYEYVYTPQKSVKATYDPKFREGITE